MASQSYLDFMRLIEELYGDSSKQPSNPNAYFRKKGAVKTGDFLDKYPDTFEFEYQYTPKQPAAPLGTTPLEVLVGKNVPGRNVLQRTTPTQPMSIGDLKMMDYAQLQSNAPATVQPQRATRDPLGSIAKQVVSRKPMSIGDLRMTEYGVMPTNRQAMPTTPATNNQVKESLARLQPVNPRNMRVQTVQPAKTSMSDFSGQGNKLPANLANANMGKITPADPMGSIAQQVASKQYPGNPQVPNTIYDTKNNPAIPYLTRKINSGEKLNQAELTLARDLGVIKSADNSGNRAFNDIKVGFGGLLSSAGGALQRYGAEGIGKEMQERGDATANIWSQRNPNLGDDIVSAIPFTLSLVPAMLAGGAAGGSLATRLGANALIKAIAGSAGATAVSRPLESLLEAGGTYNDAMARGFTVEDAEKASDQVFRNNMKLGLMDFAQLGTAFIPLPQNVKNSALKTVMTGGGKVGDISRFLGRMGLTGAQEGLEEGLQSKIQTEALGDDFSWTSPETKRAMTVGAVFGAGMGTAGAAYNAIKKSTLKRMTAKAQNDFNASVIKYTEQGMDETQAEVKALEDLAQTRAGQKVIQDAVPEAINIFNQSTNQETGNNQQATAQPAKKVRAQTLKINDIKPGQRYNLPNHGVVEVVKGAESKRVTFRDQSGNSFEMGKVQFRNQAAQGGGIINDSAAAAQVSTIEQVQVPVLDQPMTPMQTQQTAQTPNLQMTDNATIASEPPLPVSGVYPGTYKLAQGTLTKPESPVRGMQLSRREASQQPRIPQGVQDGIIPGQKYTLNNFGEVEVVDASDPAKVTIRNKNGADINVGRTAFNDLRQDQTLVQEAQTQAVGPTETGARIQPIAGVNNQGNTNISGQESGASQAAKTSAADEADQRPEQNIKSSQTGAKFKSVMFNGKGKSPSEIYGYVEKPILGEGTYYAGTVETAEQYGKDVKQVDVELANPLKISNDAEWRKLTREAGWKYPNPYGGDKNQIIKDIDNLKQLVTSKGHDGIIVSIPSGDAGKTMSNVFSHDQVVMYGTGESPNIEPAKTDAQIAPATGAKSDDDGNMSKPGAETAQEADLARLADYGLTLTKTTTKNSKTVWELSGDTKPYAKMLGKSGAGGKWFGPKKVWSFYSEEDPTDKIISNLPEVAPKKTESEAGEERQVTKDPKEMPQSPQTDQASSKKDIGKTADSDVKYSQDEKVKKEGPADGKPDKASLDTGNEKGMADGRLSPGTDDDSVRSSGREGTGVSGEDRRQDAGDISVQQGGQRTQDKPADLHAPDTGITKDQGQAGDADGTDDRQDGQRRRTGEDIEGRAGRVSDDRSDAADEEKITNRNFRIDEENPVFTKGGKKTRYKANIEALKTLQTILDEGRTAATLEEQRALALYSGWGALPEVFDYKWDGFRQMVAQKSDWSGEFKETKELMEKLGKDHFGTMYNYRGGLWENAKASTMNAHFTSPDVISLIYQAIGQMGYKKGALLEPSMGTGNFFGMIPNSMAERTKLYGVELDPLTGTIAQMLYPNAEIRIQGFQDAKYPDNFFDAAVGNVPFGDYKIPDYKYPGFVTQRIHNYFFAKTLDVVKPGGIVAYITSAGTLDAKGNARVREYLANKANFIGAIRLPGDAFKENAGTEVTTDIIFLQKLREGEFPNDVKWTGTTTYNIDGTDYSLNQYFYDNPHMIAGDLVGDKLYNSRLGAKSNNDNTLDTVADLIREHLPAEIFNTKQSQSLAELSPEVQVMAADTLDGGLVRQEGKLYRKLNTGLVEIKENVKQLEKLVELRDLVKDVLSMQQDVNVKEKDLDAKRKSMKAIYDGYVKQYGNLLVRGKVKGELSGRPHVEKALGYYQQVRVKGKSGKETAKKVFITEPETYLFKSLEIEDISIDAKGNKTQTFSPSQILTERTYTPAKPVEKVGTAAEGLVASINEFGFVDMDHIAKIYGKTEEKVIDELGDGIYRNPTGGWETDDEYLSGNVRRKLAEVRDRVELEPEYQRNVEALEKVIPEDVPITDIEVRLGDAWVPFEVTESAVARILGINQNGIKLQYSPDSNEWLLSKGKGFRHTPEMKALEAGIGIDALKIVKTAMNNGNTTVSHKDSDGKIYTDTTATNAYKAKVNELRQFLKDFIFENQKAMTLVERAYNDTFNNVVPRDYTKMAKIFNFGHLNKDVKLRDHQKVAIVRALLGGNTLLAHGVGAGKTFEQIGIAMEAKNLGLANKPLLVVPNTKLTDFENDAKKMYPGAKILALSQDDFSGDNIRRTLAMAAVNNWDMVIIRHSSFSKIPISPQTEIPALQMEIKELEDSLSSMTDESRFSVKRMEKRLENLRIKLESYSQKKVIYKGVLYFEDMGFDMLIVDEAHEFKNYPLNGAAASIKGLQSGDAAKARDLMIKSGHIRKINGSNRGLVFATGTPISNTMAEVYVMFKYLRPDLLADAGISNFDAWADTFSDIGNMMEFGAQGKVQNKKRFRGFVNLPELITMFKEFTDIKSQDELSLPLPNHELITVECAPHPALKEIMDEVQAKWDSAVKDRTLFRLLNMVRSAPQDMRLVRGEEPNHPGSKISNLVKNVVSVYKETAKDKGTQAIFLTRGESTLTGFDLWTEIKKELVKKGIPANEVAYVKSGTKESELEDIYRKVNAGKIRVVIGSYAKLGVGVNIQERLFAEHEFDVPYKPAELEQEKGRMVRQGNSYYDKGATVRTYRYITKGKDESFSGDAFSWQIVESKLKGINAMMKGDKSLRKIDAFDEEVGDAATMKALALGDERWLDKIELERQIAELNGAYNSYRSGQTRAKSSMEYAGNRLDILRRNIAKIKTAMEMEQSYQGKKDPDDKTDIIEFTETGEKVDLKSKNGKKEAEKLIRTAIAKLEKSPRKNQNHIVIAKYHDLSLEYSHKYDKDWNRIDQKLSIAAGYTDNVAETTSMRDYLGKDTSFISKDKDRNLVNDFLRGIANLQKTSDKHSSEMETLNRDIEKYKDALEKPFKRSDELREKKSKLKELDAALGTQEDIVMAGEEEQAVGDTDTETAEDEAVLPDPFQGTTPDSEKFGIVSPSFQNMGSKKKKPRGFGGRIRNLFERKDPSYGFGFEDPEMEENYWESHGVTVPGFIGKLKEGTTEFKHISTRTFPRIDPNKKDNAVIIWELVRYPKLHGLASDEAIRVLRDITKKMNKERFNVFSRKIYLDDLMEETELGNALPDGWTPELVERELGRTNDAMDDFVKEAVRLREAHNKRILDEFIEANKELGVNLESRFQRKHYFRHQVLAYMNAKDSARRTAASASRPRVHTERGTLRTRSGESTMAINTDYLQAEYEVMQQMLFDIENNKMLKRIGDKYDIRDDLSKAAARQNRSRINEIIAEELADPKAAKDKKGKPISTTDKAIKQHTWKIAKGFSDLAAMARNGTLWTGDNGQWDWAARELAKRAGTTNMDGMGFDDDSSGRLFKYLSVLVKQSGENGQPAAASILRGVSGKRELVKKILGKGYATWETVMDPETHMAWQPREGHAFYMANTVSEHLLEQLVSSGLNQLGMSESDIKQVLARGSAFRSFVLPIEIAETMNELESKSPKNIVSRALKGTNTTWKGWTLTGNPHTVIKYNLRNVTGDLDGIFATFGFKKSGIKYTQRAMKELWDAMKNGRFTDDIKEWRDFGGMQTLLTAQEISDVNNDHKFEKIRLKPQTPAEIMKRAVTFLPKTYFEFTRDMTDWREGILRYAGYLYAKEMLGKSKDGLPGFYGSSIPAMIKGLRTVEERAYQMSKDALGAYDEVTELGQYIRQYVILFHSWNEVNFKRYTRIYKNVLADDQSTKAIGRAAKTYWKIRANLGPTGLIRLGRITFRVLSFTGLIFAWNMMFPDEEDELPADVKAKPHIVLGRDGNGDILYFSRLGALNDFLDWIGLDDLINDLDELREGKKRPEEQAVDMLLSPANKIVGGLSPFVKGVFELIMGTKLYPEIQNKSTIRDRWEYLTGIVGLTSEYRYLTGKPTKESYRESWQRAFVYKADPKESNYYRALDLKRKFERVEQGKKVPTGGFGVTEKSNALYYFKQSLRFKDQDKVYKYLRKYFELGGTAKGINQSLQTMNPLYGLDADEEWEYFYWLNEGDREKVSSAVRYYEDVVRFNPKDKREKGVYNYVEKVLTSDASEAEKKSNLMPIIEEMTKESE